MTLSARISAALQSVGTDVKSLFSRAMPPGGATGTVLTKTSAGDYAAAWSAPAAFGDLTDPTRKLFLYIAHANGYSSTVYQHHSGSAAQGIGAFDRGTYGAANIVDRQQGHTLLGNGEYSAALFQMQSSQQLLQVGGPEITARIIGGFPLLGSAADLASGFIGQASWFEYLGASFADQTSPTFGFACRNGDANLSLVYTPAPGQGLTATALGADFPQSGALYQVDLRFVPLRAQAGYYAVTYTILNLGTGVSASGTVPAAYVGTTALYLGLWRYGRTGVAGKIKHMLSLASWDLVR